MPRRVRALFILLNLAGGGAERAALDLLHRFDHEAVEAALLILKREGVYSDEVPAGLRVEYLVEGGQRFRQALPRLARTVIQRARSADVVVGCLELDSTYFALFGGLIACKPVVGWVHIALEPYLRIVAPRARRWVRWTYPRLTAAVCPSTGAAHSLRAVTALPPERVHVVPNLVDVGRIELMASEPLPEWAGAVMAKPTVVGIGRLVPHKGFDLLIHSHARLRASGLDHHLLILGEGPYRIELETLVEKLSLRSSVFMPGFVRNPYPFLKRAAVFALPSRLEGMSIVLVEAMVLGVPIVATDCESGPAEVLDGGRYGVLVPPDNTHALVDGLSRLLNDGALGASFVAASRERVRVYTAEQVIPQWERLLGSVARP